MAYYNLKKKPPLTTKEGEAETLYADIVYNSFVAEGIIRREGRGNQMHFVAPKKEIMDCSCTRVIPL